MTFLKSHAAGLVRSHLFAAMTVGCLLLGVPTAPAAVVQTILTNGPSANRIDIVFLAEGYTASQSAKFNSDATAALGALLAFEPFASYKQHFNALAIFVASNQSGSDHPSYGVTRDTYFNSSYDETDFLLTIPQDSSGQGKVDALVSSFAKGAELPIVLVNDPTPGGSDGFGKAAIASTASSSADILAHEVGHVLAGLGDEYTNAYPGFPEVEEPNTTRETRRDFIKWKAWIDQATPVPTPAVFQYANTVGLFEGAHYHTTGWYRPKLDCKMNHPTVADFCEVCSEALVLSFYKSVRPMENFSPLSTNVFASSNTLLQFGASTVDSSPATLRLQWYTNGVLIPGVTNLIWQLPGTALRPGTNTVSLICRDMTPFVRTDPSQLLSQTLTWNVVNNAVSVELAQPALLPGGKFVFYVLSSGTSRVLLQSSPDLLSWSPVLTNSGTGSFWFTNQSDSGTSRKFYRAIALP